MRPNQSQLRLPYILASRVFSSTVPPKRKDNRLSDGAGLLAIIEPEFPYIAVCTSSRAYQSNEMLNVYPGETVFLYSMSVYVSSCIIGYRLFFDGCILSLSFAF